MKNTLVEAQATDIAAIAESRAGTAPTAPAFTGWLTVHKSASIVELPLPEKLVIPAPKIKSLYILRLNLEKYKSRTEYVLRQNPF